MGSNATGRNSGINPVFFKLSGKPTKNERGDKTPLTLLQAPRYSRYFVSKDQPVKLTWEATDVCKIQITCNGDKFNDGDGRAVRETCQGWKTKKKTRTIKFSDFPRASRTMNCQAKFWGINSTKTEEITLTKVCKYYFSPHVRELGFRNPGNFSCKIKNPGFWNCEFNESGILLTTGIGNPSSTDRDSGFSSTHCLGSR